MKEAIVHPGGRVELIDSSIPTPNADQVLIRVIVSGSNPKDYKMGDWYGTSANTGDDIAGIIHSIGENITEFKPGDRVAAYHQIGKDHGSFAEYAIAWGYTTFHLPKKTSFEEASTIPLAAMTAAIGLYQRLSLPEPWRPTASPLPLIVYGASTAVGAFAIKLARLSNIHPIIAVAGRGSNYVESLIDRSKGDTIIDYREGNEAIVSGIKSVLSQNRLDDVSHAVDAVSEKGSYENICQVLAPDNGKITMVLPAAETYTFPAGISHTLTMVSKAHDGVDPDSPQGKGGAITGSREFVHMYFRFFARGLQEGWFSGHPYEVRSGGLAGVEGALRDLKEGKNSALKYVFRIVETAGVEEIR